MGACYDSVFIEDKGLKLSNKELNSEWIEIQEQKCYDYGHAGYTGTLAEKINMTIHKDKVFNTKEEAEEWIEENNDKWENADCVKIKDQGWLIGGICSC
ncbi:MAG TPA: hypothetical protein VMZ91_16215 [Candidatus Paceibacterota bacterium]|nr:hypothetical protein [Candidatus Paceibacterota bacterium]